LIKNQVPRSASLVCVNLGALICAADAPIYGFLRKLDIPYVLIVHSNPEINQYPGTIAGRLCSALRKAAWIFFVSRRLHENVRCQLLVDLTNAGIAKNPVNLKSTDRPPWPSDRTVRMAVVGRLDAWLKGQVRLLEVLGKEKWLKRDWSLSIFGEGPDEERISRAISFFGLEGRAFLRGHVNDVAEEIWSKHHVLIMPSLFEGMSLAMVEAMLCGRVVVASDVGGATELIEHGRSGFIAGSPFCAQLDEALENLWERRADLQRIGAQAYEKAAKYVPSDAGQRLLENIVALAR
jgi:glycosyltransferase involved in cell wall biosynthesis